MVSSAGLVGNASLASFWGPVGMDASQFRGGSSAPFYVNETKMARNPKLLPALANHIIVLERRLCNTVSLVTACP